MRSHRECRAGRAKWSVLGSSCWGCGQPAAAQPQNHNNNKSHDNIPTQPSEARVGKESRQRKETHLRRWFPGTPPPTSSPLALRRLAPLLVLILLWLLMVLLFGGWVRFSHRGAIPIHLGDQFVMSHGLNAAGPRTEGASAGAAGGKWNCGSLLVCVAPQRCPWARRRASSIGGWL